MNNVSTLHRDPDWLIGPFECWQVVIDGRAIPNMTARRTGDQVVISLDNRLTIAVPADIAYQVAAFAANAMAIGAGYSHLGAETRERPFAPRAAKLDVEAT